MEKKKLFMIIGAAALIVIVIILLISSKGQQGGAKINSITLATGVTKDKQVTGVTEIFSTEISEIYAIVNIASIPAGSQTEFQWYDVGAKKALKSEKGQTKSNFSGSVTYSIKKQENKWGKGSYEFRVLIGGKVIAKKAYKVMLPEDISKEKILSVIKDVVLAKEVDLRGKPKGEEFTNFSVSDKNIYASVSYQGVEKKTEFEGKWIFSKEDKLIKSYKKTLSGEGTFAFSINTDSDAWLPVKEWAKGKYTLEIYLDGDLMKEIPFEVS